MFLNECTMVPGRLHGSDRKTFCEQLQMPCGKTHTQPATLVTALESSKVVDLGILLMADAPKGVTYGRPLPGDEFTSPTVKVGLNQAVVVACDKPGITVSLPSPAHTHTSSMGKHCWR